MFYFSKTSYVFNCQHFENVVKLTYNPYIQCYNFMNFQLYKLFRLNSSL